MDNGGPEPVGNSTPLPAVRNGAADLVKALAEFHESLVTLIISLVAARTAQRIPRDKRPTGPDDPLQLFVRLAHSCQARYLALSQWLFEAGVANRWECELDGWLASTWHACVIEWVFRRHFPGPHQLTADDVTAFFKTADGVGTGHDTEGSHDGRLSALLASLGRPLPARVQTMLFRLDQELVILQPMAAKACATRAPRPAASARPNAVSATNPPASTPAAGDAQNRRRAGRPVDTDVDEDRRIGEAWKSGHHRTVADLAQALGKDLQHVRNALDRQRKRLRN